jgi:hypothetical protein
MPKKSSAVLRANLGLYLDRPPLNVPPRGLTACNNIRINGGRITNQGIGWEEFTKVQLNGPVTLIDNYFLRSGSQILLFGSTKDLYRYVEGTDSVLFITRRYETGTLTATKDSATLTGVGTAWNTNLQAGDEIAIGATGFAVPNGGNLLGYSQEFENTDWTANNVTIAANTTNAPDSTLTADRILETATTTVHELTQNVDLEDSTTYFASVHVRTGTGRNWIHLRVVDKAGTVHGVYFDTTGGVSGTTTGSPSNIAITAAGNSFFRCSFSFNSASGATVPQFDVRIASADGTDSYLGDAGFFMYYWGAQLHAPSPTVELRPYSVTTWKWYEILTVDSATQITLTNPYREPTMAAGTAYTARKLFTGDEQDYWRAETFPKAQPEDADLWFATNGGVDAIVQFDSTDDQITLLDTIGFKCKELLRYKNMLIYGNLVLDSGEARPFSIKNSDIGSPATFAIEGSEFVAHDGLDPVNGLYALGDNLVIYGQRTITLTQFVGTPLIFVFRSVVTGLGPLSGRLVADFGDFHEFLGPDAGYRFDGVTVDEIGFQVWRETLRQQDPLRLPLGHSHFDEERGVVMWALPLTTDPNSQQTDSALAEHYVEDVPPTTPVPFTRQNFRSTASGFFDRLATLRFSDITTTWASQNFKWNDQFFQAAFPFNLFGDANGFIYTLGTADAFDGASIASFARFSRRAAVDERRKGVIRRVYPFAERLPGASTYTLAVIVWSAEQAAGDLTNKGQLGYDLTHVGNRFVSPRASGRFFEIEFATTGVNQIWTLQGYDTDVEVMGER